jgi:hypothetical protein
LIKILDWFYIGVKFGHLLNVIPPGQKGEVERIKWNLWRGKVKEVFSRLDQLKELFSQTVVGKKFI